MCERARTRGRKEQQRGHQQRQQQEHQQPSKQNSTTKPSTAQQNACNVHCSARINLGMQNKINLMTRSIQHSSKTHEKELTFRASDTHFLNMFLYGTSKVTKSCALSCFAFSFLHFLTFPVRMKSFFTFLMFMSFPFLVPCADVKVHTPEVSQLSFFWTSRQGLLSV